MTLQTDDFANALRDLLARLAEPTAQDATACWQALLQALVGNSPVEASTLMVMDGDACHPVAVLGLSDEVRGRRFALREHPRLAAIAAHPGLCRFAPDSELPDPFDGLLDEQMSQVHDCLGVALRDGHRVIGLLTCDALEPHALASLDEASLGAAADLLGTCLCLAQRLQQTRSQLNAVLSESPRQAPLSHWASPAMRRLMASVDLVAGTDMSVLLGGETGVGKEAVARELHLRSARADAPLVRVNCAALPDSLIESALFGHRRGAFSGAVGDHRGHFAMADGGTLMLDEIGELPLSLQPKLLRALQEGEIQPLGSESSQRLDVRVIAVTNRDLQAEVRAGRFREDLYHRLSAFPLRVPPLRERVEDIPLLAGRFLEDNRVRLGVGNLCLSREAEAALLGGTWPGNVRELEHVIARAALRALEGLGSLEGEARRQVVLRLLPAHLQLDDSVEMLSPPDTTRRSPAAPEPVALRAATDDFQRRLIRTSLERHAGNWAATARALDMDAGNLHRLARRLGLKQ